MQSNSAQSVLPKPALLLFLLLLLLLQPFLHLPSPFSNFSNPSPPFSKSIAWQPLQPSSQPSSQVSPHNKSTLALFHTSPPKPLLCPNVCSIYLPFSYFSDLRISCFGTPLRSANKNKYALLWLMDFELCCISEMKLRYST